MQGVGALVWLAVAVVGAAGAALLRPRAAAPARRAAAPGREFGEAAAPDTADYVVVGAGSAGCVVARRLADAGHRVVLLEAGDGAAHRAPACRDDLAGWFGLLTSEFDHDLCTEPQAGMGGRALQYARGLALGGSSTINAQMWVAGHRADYDDWAKVHGCGDEWAWDNVSKHLAQIERYAEGGATRGKAGAFEINKRGANNPAHAAFLKATSAVVGIDIVDDYNAGDNTGVAFCQQNNSAAGEREDAFTALIEPYLRDSSKSNLVVVDRARAECIVFDDSGDEPRATGVVFRVPGRGVHVVSARKEVIVSAGAFHSPHLLMLSGVGPAAHLRELGIRVRVDASGVGANAQDHPAVSIPVELKTPLSRDPAVADGTGFDTTAHFYSSWAKKHEPNRGPDMQFCGIACPPFIDGAVPFSVAVKIMNCAPRDTLKGRVFRNLIDIVKRTLVPIMRAKIDATYSLGVVLNHPTSVGSVRLRSADPADEPMIDLGLLQTDADRERFVEAVRLALKVEQHKAFAPVKEWEPEIAALAKPDATDDDILRRVQALGAHAWHIAGTVAMGGDADKPLSPDCRVRGTRGLRVIDASCMPTLPSGNTNIPSIMVGSIGADFVLRDA